VEEEKVSVYEASGRTGVRVARIQEALKRKTDEAKAKSECHKPKMEFNFGTTTSREELLAKPMKQKIARLQNIADGQAHAVNTAAYNGQSYLWEMDEPKLAQYLQQTNNHGGLSITLDEVMEALRARFPGCKVERAEEWVDVPNRHHAQPPTRTLKSGIKIDWA
jgi:regulatory protein YycI of two-component signal transduction system YycFG